MVEPGPGRYTVEVEPAITGDIGAEREHVLMDERRGRLDAVERAVAATGGTMLGRAGEFELAGRRIGVAGLGKVGRYLVGHLLGDGASVVATDVSEKALEWARRNHPEVDLVPDVTALITSDIDVYAPCALGGALNDATVPQLRAKIVAGAANNQLAHGGVEKLLAERGILYAPDYVINAGGVIQVADEIKGFNFERAKLQASGIFETTRRILRLADDEGVSPATAADRLAEQRMAEVGRLRTIRIG